MLKYIEVKLQYNIKNHHVCRSKNLDWGLIFWIDPLGIIWWFLFFYVFAFYSVPLFFSVEFVHGDWRTFKMQKLV